MTAKQRILRAQAALSLTASLVFLFFGSPTHGETLMSVKPGGPSGLKPSLIYATPTTFSGLPIPVAGGSSFGLDEDADVIGGFSADKEASSDFLLCFSVDSESVGMAEPASFPSAGGLIAYNVLDQARKRQHAGDAFLTTEAFDRTGLLPMLPDGPGLGLSNNVLVINQSAPYATYFGLMPLLPPDSTGLGGVIDDVNGGESLPVDASGMPMLEPLYFSLDPTSPSLEALTVSSSPSSSVAATSAANIFYDATVELVDGPSMDTSLYASALDLGLSTADVLSALTVFDDNDDGLFNGTDQILFSLEATSPSLATIGSSPGDILTVSAGGSPTIFASAEDLGLDPLTDNVNMLVPVPFSASVTEAIQTKLVPEPAQGLLFAFVFMGSLSLTRRRP